MNHRKIAPNLSADELRQLREETWKMVYRVTEYIEAMLESKGRSRAMEHSLLFFETVFDIQPFEACVMTTVPDSRIPQLHHDVRHMYYFGEMIASIGKGHPLGKQWLDGVISLERLEA